MKNILKTFLIMLGAVSIFIACNKVDDLPFYPSGSAPVLSSDVATVAPMPADSSNTVLTLSWSNPKYALDSSTVKYVVQIDSSGKNFSNPYTREVTGSLSTSFVAKDLNAVLLDFGFDFGVSYSIDIRVVSSYPNNNDQQFSNTITIQATPYIVPPKVMPPTAHTLYIVGDATAGGWNNPVPVPAQQFTMLDSVTYEGTFYLAGGRQYLLLPVNGSWDEKYAVKDNTIPNLSAGGDFGYYSSTNQTEFNSNFPAPPATGMYTIHVDFQHGAFTVTPVKTFALLYVPGDYQNWDPASAPQLASVNSDGKYEGYVYFPSNSKFKFTSQPNWDGTNYGDGGAGQISTSGDNLSISGPAYYKINVNTNDNTWSATPTTWGLIGSFAGSGWSNDVDMTFDSNSNTWTGTITIADGDEFKFRANHDWGLNYGDSGADGSLEEGGDNIKGIAAGTHTVTLYLSNAGYYTYKIQ